MTGFANAGFPAEDQGDDTMLVRSGAGRAG